MPQYLLPRIQETLVSSNIPETHGIRIEQAFELARTAQACITLSSTDMELFQANLPPEAPDYHSYDDLTELIWRSWLSDPDIKPYAKENPQNARGQSIAIWKTLIKHSAPELYSKLRFFYYEPLVKVVGIKSALRRTAISDPAVHEFYERAKAGSLPSGIGRASVTSMQMLLAGTHPDLIEADWPTEVLEFMESSDVAI